MTIYEKNIESLRKYHPELAEVVEAIKIGEDRIRVFYAETGEPRVLYKRDDGEEVYIHSAEDPAKCANEAIELLGKIEKEGLVVLFGFGLGYFAEEVFKKFEKGHILLIYEATIELFKTALKLRDFSELFDSERVKIILGETVESIVVVHTHYNHIINGRFWVVKHHPSVKLNGKAYEKFFSKLEEEHISMKTGVITGMGLGNKFMETFIENIPSVLRKPGVTKLKNVFQGRPAIVVAAGPSLDKNIHLLKKAKGKAIIVAVEAALPTLLPCNIVPDIVVALDPLEKNIRLIKDNPLLRQVHFICLPQFTPEVVRMYPGAIFMNSLPGNIAYQWLARFWEDKGYIDCTGGSVANFAFGAAEFLGAEIIALVGQDLSFKGEESHTKGFKDVSDMILKEAVQKNDMRDVIVETEGTFQAMDIFGEQVLSRTDFLTFKTNFERKFREFRGAVLNATEGGLVLKGAPNIRLMDFIDEYCENIQEIDAFAILSGFSHEDVSYNLNGLWDEVTTARSKFKEIRKNSEKVLKYIERAKTLRDKGRKDSYELHNVLGKIESLIELIRNPILNLMTGYKFSLELYLLRLDIQEVDEIEDKWERLDKQLERGMVYYREISQAIKLFDVQLDRLINNLKREKKVNSILSDNSLIAYKKYSSIGTLYKKDSMVTQAVKYMEKAVSEVDSPKPELLLSLADLYLRQFRFYDAKNVLERDRGIKGIKGKGQFGKILGLIKECDDKIKAWKKCKEEMALIVENAEKNYGGDLESGYFYFRVKDYERAEKAYMKAISSQQSAVSPDKVILSAAYYGLAHIYLAKEEPEKAVEALEKAIEIEPGNPVYYRDLGYIAYQNGNIESAELFFNRAIELSPQTVELYKLLADLYVGQNDVEKAIALYEDALLANPDNLFIQQELTTLYKTVISNTGRA